MPIINKNTSGQYFHCIAFNTSGRITGAESKITCKVSIDDGGYNPLSDTNPTEIESSGEYRFTLTQAETNGDVLSFIPIITNLAGDDVLGVPSNLIDTTPATPAGAGAVEYEVEVQSSGIPIAGVEVWYSTDIAGTNVVGGTAVTDSLGKATTWLDAGAYYMWRESSTHTFPNPTAVTVS